MRQLPGMAFARPPHNMPTAMTANLNAVDVSWRRLRSGCVVCAVVIGCDGTPGTDGVRAAPWYAVADTAATWSVEDDASLCSDCIGVERVAVIGDSTADGFVVETHSATQDSAGRYWLGQRERIKVFGPTGNWIKTIGRPGRGPFEFVMAKPVYTDAKGRVHVVDPGNAREAVYADNFSPQMERRLPSGDPFDLVAIDDGEAYVMNMWLRSATGAGLAFHLVRGGDVIRSFGAPDDGEMASAFTSQRHVAVDTGGRLFAAERFSFDIVARNPAGGMILRLTGPVLNAKPVRAGLYDLTENPVPNEIVAIRADRHARLWVVSRRIRSDWTSYMTQTVFPDGTVGLVLKPGATVDSLAYTRLEVVDLHKRRVVARLDQHGNLTEFIGDDLLLQNSTDQDGVPHVLVWRVKARLP